MSERFFRGVDTLGIVEQHVKQILKLQDSEAGEMVRLYRQVRQELRDRLDHLPARKFQAQHLRGVFAQVDAAIRAMEAKLRGHMNAAALKIALQGAEHIAKEMDKLQGVYSDAVTPINLNVVQVAHDTHTLLVRKYESSLKTYSESVRQGITQELTRAAVQEDSYADVVRNLSRYFTGEEWKVHRLARTELHGVYNLAKLKGLKDLRAVDFPDLKKALIHPMDQRTGLDSIELAEQNPIVDIDKPFVQNFRSSPKAKPVRYVFMVPPDRPNDRAVVVPFREEWG